MQEEKEKEERTGGKLRVLAKVEPLANVPVNVFLNVFEYVCACERARFYK